MNVGVGARLGLALRRCHEVDERLDRAEQLGFEVFPAGDPSEDVFPESAGWSVDAERREHAFLPGLPMGDVGPAVDSDRRRLHRLPDVDEGVAGDEDVRIGDRRRDPLLLRSLDEVVEQHAESAAIAGPEAADAFGEIVGPLELFDDDPFDPQVGAPDLFDQLGVVDAFDPDPAGSGDASGDVAEVDRPACGERRLGAGLGGRGHEAARHSLAVDSGAHRAVAVGDGVVLAVPVAQDQPRGCERHQRADHAGGSVFEHQAASGGDDRVVGPPGSWPVEIDLTLVHGGDGSRSAVVGVSTLGAITRTVE